MYLLIVDFKQAFERLNIVCHSIIIKQKCRERYLILLEHYGSQLRLNVAKIKLLTLKTATACSLYVEGDIIEEVYAFCYLGKYNIWNSSKISRKPIYTYIRDETYKTTCTIIKNPCLRKQMPEAQIHWPNNIRNEVL